MRFIVRIKLKWLIQMIQQNPSWKNYTLKASFPLLIYINDNNNKNNKKSNDNVNIISNIYELLSYPSIILSILKLSIT